jgi:hypothetical protein
MLHCSTILVSHDNARAFPRNSANRVGAGYRSAFLRLPSSFTGVARLIYVYRYRSDSTLKCRPGQSIDIERSWTVRVPRRSPSRLRRQLVAKVLRNCRRATHDNQRVIQLGVERCHVTLPTSSSSIAMPSTASTAKQSPIYLYPPARSHTAGQAPVRHASRSLTTSSPYTFPPKFAAEQTLACSLWPAEIFPSLFLAEQCGCELRISLGFAIVYCPVARTIR